MIHYISTRGQSAALSFEDVVLAGLAPDGGLYVPDTLPTVTAQQLAAWKKLSYPELALQIIRPFVGDAFSENELRQILKETYASPWKGEDQGGGASPLAQPADRHPHPTSPFQGEAIVFDHPDIAPLIPLGENETILELFHGPTLAFKDFALQFLGRILDRILQKRKLRIAIVGATSGDTGSAAISGCRGRDNVDIFILHPKGRTSEVQRRQMTTVTDKNVYNIAITGTFDDCQDIVKALFNDTEFRARQHLVAVNSINWARILAQVVYYFYAALKFNTPPVFSVPTGNFGDIYAGYIAQRMGLPISKLIIASNRNDILTRCYNTGTYKMEGVHPSLSPSMDIQVSSNFERLLYDLSGGNADVIRELMNNLKTKKSFTLPEPMQVKLRSIFLADCVSDDDTRKTIAQVYKDHGILIDPHTAVGVAAVRRFDFNDGTPIVTLSTAHPAKFPEAVMQATGKMPQSPSHLANLLSQKERYETLANDAGLVRQYIEKHHVV